VALAGLTIATAGCIQPFGLDQSWHDWLAANRNPAAVTIATFLTVAGGTLVLTIVTVAVVALLLVLHQPIAFPQVWSWVLASIWIPPIALSRDYLLVHWLSDVLAGVLLGSSVALLVAAIVGRFLKERSPDNVQISGSHQGANATLAP